MLANISISGFRSLRAIGRLFPRAGAGFVLTMLLLLGASSSIHAQTVQLRGRLADTAGHPVANGAVSLLSPADSTMEAFGVSDPEGVFEIRAVKPGNYLLQVAGIGYAMQYRPLMVPVAGNDLGFIVLRRDPQLLQEIEVKGVKIPVLLRGDTVEYNAGSFRVKEDAVVEELLKKLPGVQVDNSGNVKALGKDVQRVLVDGKEFFGNDPKMATKNLPADAIDKVQVFGNRSDAAKFTGVDDGVRDQTINLQMKKDRRNGYFGNVEAGGGSDERYQGAARVFRFKPEQQLAVLGMLNNINRFGFSFQDYLSFQGGIQNMSNGSGRLRMSTDMPIDFGRPVAGLITSGAAGINFSNESRRGVRSNVSYLGNGADKLLDEQRTTQNFTPGGTFTTREQSRATSRDMAHRLTAGWKTMGDSVNQTSLQASARLTDNAATRTLQSASDIDGTVRNRLSSALRDDALGYEITATGSFLHKTKSRGWPVLKLRADARLEHVGAATDWNNVSSFLLDTTLITDRQYQRNTTDGRSWNAGVSAVRKLGRGLFIEPGLGVTYDNDALTRVQGFTDTELANDSLSAAFSRRWMALRPGIDLRYNTKRTQLSIGIEAEAGALRRDLADMQHMATAYTFFKPQLFYQYSWEQSSQLSVNYSTEVTQPSAQQMLPVANYLNPLQRSRGAESLRPEYAHTLTANWVRFDQFSGMSFMAHGRGILTRDKIGWARFIRADLSEDLIRVNVAEDYVADAGVEFSTPLRKLGLELTVGLEERFNLGQSFVNSVQNVNRTFNHSGRMRLQSKKLKYLDVEAGVSGDITQARASIEPGLQTQFYHYNADLQVLWKPHTRFNISLRGTLDRYTSSGFQDAVTIPLLNASASWYFLKFNRGVLTLDAFDLLNRNTAIQRISQLNVLMEQRSNIIRQYVMLSFKYRLSKTSGNNGLNIRVN